MVPVVTLQGGTPCVEWPLRCGDLNSLAITLSDWVPGKVAYFQMVQNLEMV